MRAAAAGLPAFFMKNFTSFRRHSTGIIGGNGVL